MLRVILETSPQHFHLLGLAPSVFASFVGQPSQHQLIHIFMINGRPEREYHRTKRTTSDKQTTKKITPVMPSSFTPAIEDLDTCKKKLLSPLQVEFSSRKGIVCAQRIVGVIFLRMVLVLRFHPAYGVIRQIVWLSHFRRRISVFVVVGFGYQPCTSVVTP